MLKKIQRKVDKINKANEAAEKRESANNHRPMPIPILSRMTRVNLNSTLHSEIYGRKETVAQYSSSPSRKMFSLINDSESDY